MKKFSILLVFIIGLLFLNGCWDKHELEDNIFVILLGIDMAENKNVMITIAFPLTQTEGGGLNEGMDNGSGNYSIMSVSAPTLVEGLNLFSTKISGPLALYTVKTIVISQELAHSDLPVQIFSSWRHAEIRNTTNILVSECKAVEFIETRIKNSPINPLRQEELLLEQANNSAYYKPIQFLEFIANLKSDSGDSIAMYGEITAKNNNEIPILAGNESQLSGLAIFHGAKMVGVLDSLETQTYSMLAQGKGRKILTLPDPLDPEYNIVAEILPAGKNKISSSINDGVPIFNIDLTLKCAIESIQSQIDYTSVQNYNILEEYIKSICEQNMANLINKIQKEYNADILKLGDKLAYRFSTVKEWEEYDWLDKYKDAEINLNVRLNIERTGIMTP